MINCLSRTGIVLLIVLANLSCPPAFADVRLPAILSDNMVFQQGRPLTVWGWADAGEKVTVEIDGHSRTGTTLDDGTWSVRVGPLKTGGPYLMKITGKNVVEVHNILAGEVWLGSGQSNMEQPMAGFDFNGDGVRTAPINNSTREIAAADYPSIRMFTAKKRAADRPLEDVEGKWDICAPSNAPNLSATGYFFSRHLFQNLAVPVGFVHSSSGGSAIELWIPSRAFDKDPSLSQGYEYLCRTTDLEHWPKCQKPHGTFYNGMIAPALRFSIRGVVWYQGEANTVAAHAYGHAFRTLIKEWRSSWRNNKLPFLFVQIAPHDYTRYVGHGWPMVDSPNVRQAQLSALELPFTGMAVTTDIGDALDIHPGNKQEVGRRLALLTLGLVYKRSVDYSGPIFRSRRLEDDHVRITFRYAKSGLKSRDGLPLNWFTVAGEDRKFVPANAVIEKDCVLVSSPSVPRPVAVRFAWADVADHNLVNLAGLPASPFRTDNWPTAQEDLDKSTAKQ